MATNVPLESMLLVHVEPENAFSLLTNIDIWINASTVLSCNIVHGVEL